ncbi:Protein DJ-1-like [Gracilariopsis chorda]|uniref:Protein DJ-1-like n=1 Tax=Gracilariopsis chorda TaxID=448386 RepID=A0A2V3IVG6_9FLOR|nr:Protein DJ-1-like [Gracilariopsis chorda]|eukprot:PXF46124.1 Protein DJ-1-like [Gracilariopsis chorda]
MSDHTSKPAFFVPSPIQIRHPRLPSRVNARPHMTAMAPRRVLVTIGTGSEEIETAAAVDTLRRAGADVTLASVESSLEVNMSRGMSYKADILVADATPPYDAIALPGGMPGAERLRDSEKLTALLKDAASSGRIVAAVCASPAVVLASHGLLDGVDATCYPADGFVKQIVKKAEADVVVGKDGTFITGTGPGTAIKWALAIVEALYGKEKADKIASDMLVTRD